jgi:hypothetical protein
MDRDNVTPAYLRDVRTIVVNALHDKLDEADAASTFVNEALADENASPEAVKTALDLKYGPKRFIHDPSDPEANMNLVSQGYVGIHGAQLTKSQWANVKKHDAQNTRPGGQIAPTKKALFSADGDDVWVPREKWTAAMTAVAEYTRRISQALLDAPVTVSILSDVKLGYAACFGDQGFVFNLGRVGHRFFNACYEALEHEGVVQLDAQSKPIHRFAPTVELNTLIIHELGHHYEPNHLDERYHEALCKLGGRMTQLALTQPELFRGMK